MGSGRRDSGEDGLIDSWFVIRRGVVKALAGICFWDVFVVSGSSLCSPRAEGWVIPNSGPSSTAGQGDDGVRSGAEHDV